MRKTVIAYSEELGYSFPVEYELESAARLVVALIQCQDRTKAAKLLDAQRTIVTADADKATRGGGNSPDCCSARKLSEVPGVAGQ